VAEHQHAADTPRGLPLRVPARSSGRIEENLGLAVRGVDAEGLRYAVGASSRTRGRGVGIGSITDLETLLDGSAAGASLALIGSSAPRTSLVLIDGSAPRTSLGLSVSCF
jgi:hypothetical protein